MTVINIIGIIAGISFEVGVVVGLIYAVIHALRRSEKQPGNVI